MGITIDYVLPVHTGFVAFTSKERVKPQKRCSLAVNSILNHCNSIA